MTPMIFLALALALQSPTQGWTDEFTCFDPAVYSDPCDVRCHVHLADIGIPGQGAMDLGPWPQFGQIGSSITLHVHRNRFLTVGSVLQQGAVALVSASLAHLDPPPYVSGVGWAWVNPSHYVASWTGVADSAGFATVSFSIPADPCLVGVELYFQALVNERGALRESTGGRLEIWQ